MPIAFFIASFLWNVVTREPVPVDSSCEADWIQSPATSYCYFAYPARTYWSTARDLCLELGGDLVSIHSPEEDAFIFSIQPGGLSWLGLTDKENEGVFPYFTDGTPVDYLNFGDPSGAEYASRDCACMYGGHWYWNHCWNRAPVICKKPHGSISTIHPPSTQLLIDGDCYPDWVHDPTSGTCYLFWKGMRTVWEAAILHCRLAGGDLASIHSAEENAFIFDIISKDVWIGLSDKAHEGVLSNFSDGTPVDFQNFAVDDEQHDEKHCVYMNAQSGEWMWRECAVQQKAVLRVCKTLNTTAQPILYPTFSHPSTTTRPTTTTTHLATTTSTITTHPVTTTRSSTTTHLATTTSPAITSVPPSTTPLVTTALPATTTQLATTALPTTTTHLATTTSTITTHSVTTTQPSTTTHLATTTSPAITSVPPTTTPLVTTALPATTTQLCTTPLPAMTTNYATTTNLVLATLSATTTQLATTTQSVTTTKFISTTLSATTTKLVTTIDPITTTHPATTTQPGTTTHLATILIAITDIMAPPCEDGYRILLYIGNGFRTLCLLLAGLMFLYKIYREGYRKQYCHHHYVWIGTALLFHYIVFTAFVDSNPATGYGFEEIFVHMFFAFTTLFLFVAEGIKVYQSTKLGDQANNSFRQICVCLICMFTSAVLSLCTAVCIHLVTKNSERPLTFFKNGSNSDVDTFLASGFYVLVSLIGFATVVILALANQNLTSNFVFMGHRVRIIRHRIMVDAVMLVLTILSLELWYPAFYFRKYQVGPFTWVSVLNILINFVEGIAFLMLFCSAKNAVADASIIHNEGTSMQEGSSRKHVNGHVVSGDVAKPPVEQPPDNIAHNQVDQDLEANMENLSPVVSNPLQEYQQAGN